MSTVFSPFVRGETVRLELPRDQWILVKRELTAGETRRMFSRLVPKTGAMPTNGDEAVRSVDMFEGTHEAILVYLLDWSLVDPDGKPVVIHGKSREDLSATLDALTFDMYSAISKAIRRHRESVERELEALNADPFGEPMSASTLQSVG